MKRVLFATIFVLSLCQLMAQPHPGKFNPEDFKAKMEHFIAHEAQLTHDEAETFFPIFHEMKLKQREYQKKIFELKRGIEKSEKSESDYSKIVQEITELNIEIAKTESTYYKKLCKAVPAKKVLLAMNAEDRFHRQMLEQFNPNKPRNPQFNEPKGQKATPRRKK